MTDAAKTRNKYLVCVGRGDGSKAALRLACARAKKNNRAVELLHVIEPADFQSLFAVADKVRQERREEAEALLQELALVGLELGITPSMNLREGPRGDEILKAALEDADVSLLVLGVETMAAKQRSLIAWLVTQIGGKLLIPVMLVPGNLTDLQIEELI